LDNCPKLSEKLQTPADAQEHFVLVSQPWMPQNQCKRGSQNTYN
jgi:hypothetical protein